LPVSNRNYPGPAAADTRPAALCAIALAVSVAACGGTAALPTAASAATAPVPPVLRLTRTRFLVFGDSLTAGTTSPAMTTLGAGLPESFPFKLLALLTARYAGQPIVVENEGRPAESAQSGALRLPGVLRALAPEVVILLHGVNDVTFYGTAGVGRTAEYLNTMARDARLSGAEVVICTLPPQRPGGGRAGDPAAIAAYNDALRDIARGEAALLVDFDRSITDLSLIGVDGLHPTEAGYARMAQLLAGALSLRYGQ
jgi:lysophospholipase L1-like esterase